VTVPARHHAVQVPATTANLGPGFDAFGVAIDRYLAVRSIDRSDQTQRVRTVRGDPVPEGDDNLVWCSLVAFCEHHGVAVPDVALLSANAIPLERGMGSSSAAIVAGLVLGRALTGVAVGDPDLVRLADRLEGHPDNVAPAVLGGLVACAPGAEGLVVRRVNPAAHLRPVVLVPPFRQATEPARQALPPSVPREALVSQSARAGHVLAALAGTWPVDVGASGDLLHEPVRTAGGNASGAALRELRQAGIHAWLSGAGPSVAAAVPSAWGDELAVLGPIARRHGLTVETVRFELSGALACPDGACGIDGGRDCVHCPRRWIS